jgi:hypothetical protein
LREARRQKGAPPEPVPAVCLLDPDGDIVRRLRAEGRSRRHPGWVCYHTELDVFTLDGRKVGVVGCAVGAAFAATRGRSVLGVAHVTNRTGQIDGDFEKGAADGVEDALALVTRTAARLAPAG